MHYMEYRLRLDGKTYCATDGAEHAMLHCRMLSQYFDLSAPPPAEIVAVLSSQPRLDSLRLEYTPETAYEFAGILVGRTREFTEAHTLLLNELQKFPGGVARLRVECLEGE